MLIGSCLCGILSDQFYTWSDGYTHRARCYTFAALKNLSAWLTKRDISGPGDCLSGSSASMLSP